MKHEIYKSKASSLCISSTFEYLHALKHDVTPLQDQFQQVQIQKTTQDLWKSTAKNPALHKFKRINCWFPLLRTQGTLNKGKSSEFKYEYQERKTKIFISIVKLNYWRD